MLAYIAAILGSADLTILDIDGLTCTCAGEGNGFTTAVALVHVAQRTIEIYVCMSDGLVEVVLVVFKVCNVVFDVPFASNRVPIHKIGLGHIGNFDVGRERVLDVRVGESGARTVLKEDFQVRVEHLTCGDGSITQRYTVARVEVEVDRGIAVIAYVDEVGRRVVRTGAFAFRGNGYTALARLTS